MNILLIGSGGREHTLAWKISQSKKCDQLFIAPGNGGTKYLGTNIPISANNFQEIGTFCLENKIEMVVVGPEEPLVKGIVDHFNSHDFLKDIQVVGPSRKGAQLEGSKAFSKNFMEMYDIPTADYLEVTEDNLLEGFNQIEKMNTPVVLKADGLAAGKGVLICQTVEEAKSALQEMIMENKFGDAGKRVVIEEFLKGMEFSVFILTDGESYKLLPTAKDYKRVGEGDTGLNTGGMGAISPVPFVNNDLLQKVENNIILPTIKGLLSENIVYKGFLYFGLMNVNDEPYVIEYNVRMGDPETEVVIPRIKNDIIELFLGIKHRTLDQIDLEIEPRTCTTVVLASGGYPGKYEKEKVITGLDDVEQSIVFHAGTKYEEDQLVTNGGRVLAVSSFGKNITEALEQCYEDIANIKFEGKYFRKDIGFDLKQSAVIQER